VSRAAFERECLAALRPLLKASGWKKRDNVLFAEVDGFYVEAGVLVQRDKPATRVECAFKPMALDPLLWEISGEQQCLAQPLSFRSYGIGTCSTHPLLAADIADAGDDAATVAARILPVCSSANALLRTDFGARKFSDLVAALVAQGVRGNLAITRIMALIDEGNLPGAHDAAEASLASHAPVSAAAHRVGKLFEHRILRWLDGRASTQQAG
jgi:hypothetical protein